MNDEAIKMSFIRSQLQIVCEISRTQCLDERSPPSDLMRRAKKKAEEEIAQGHAAFFLFHEKELEKVWTQLAVSDENMEDIISFVLAVGAPHLKGVKIAPVRDSDEKALAFITFNNPGALVASWPFAFFTAALDHFQFEGKSKQRINHALLHFVWLRACLGEKIIRFPLMAMNEHIDPNKDYAFFVDSDHRYIAARLYNQQVLIHDERRQAFYRSIKKTVTAASAKHKLEYYVVSEDFRKNFELARKGPGRLGLGMPLTFLVAIPAKEPIPKYLEGRLVPFSENLSFQDGVSEVEQETNLLFAITPDKLQASIDAFDSHMYSHFSVSRSWIQQEMRKNKIIFGESEELWKKIEMAILKEENLNGFVVAVGEPAQAPLEPFLQNGFEVPEEDIAQRGSRDLSRLYVRKGKLAAYIAYKKPGMPGTNVMGDKFEAASTDVLDVEVGDGISTSDSKNFYADRDGIPEIVEKKISLKPLFVHEGDIDFKSGNVNYNGNVVIAGSVLPGSVIDVVGDVNITGGIFGASLYVNGNVTIDEGIRSLAYGRISGKLTSKFLENSRIFCAGDIVVHENVINCELYAKSITVKGGTRCLVVGGNIVCEKEIICNNLGLNGGATTRIRLGRDVVSEFRLMQRRKRHASLKKVLDQELANLRELQNRQDNQLSSSQREKKAKLTVRVKRLQGFIDTLDANILKLQTGRSCDMDAHIDVIDAFSPNVEISICDKPVSLKGVTDKVLNVKVHLKDNHAIVGTLGGKG